MTAPNMAAITASLERSLQNFSLNHRESSSSDNSSSSSTSAGFGFQRSDSPAENSHHRHSDDATLELNSHISLPYHWEQCLDLKTGEVYYINWRTGMKAKEDPRMSNGYEEGGRFYSDDEEDDDEEDEDDDNDNDVGDDDETSYDSEGYSSAESAPASSSKRRQQKYVGGDDEEGENSNFVRGNGEELRDEEGSVLVVAGCKSCLMYYMVPKRVGDCPKCTGQLLHFDRSDDTASP